LYPLYVSSLQRLHDPRQGSMRVMHAYYHACWHVTARLHDTIPAVHLHAFSQRLGAVPGAAYALFGSPSFSFLTSKGAAEVPGRATATVLSCARTIMNRICAGIPGNEPHAADGTLPASPIVLVSAQLGMPTAYLLSCIRCSLFCGFCQAEKARSAVLCAPGRGKCGI
jgi:hypothetical protein